MAVIEPRRQKDGTLRYRARVTLKGHPRLSATFQRKTDAREWAQTTEAALKEGRHFPTREATRKTLGDVVERFTKEKIPLRAPRDHSRLESQLTWWLEQLGADLPLAQLTPARIAVARDRLVAGGTPSGKPASPATVKRYLAILSKALAVASKEWFWMQPKLSDSGFRRRRLQGEWEAVRAI